MTPRFKGQITTHHRQHGAALLIMLTLIVLAASYTLLKRVNAQKPEIVRAADNAQVLGQAKAALMGYAIRQDSPNRPGQLPCPDRLPAAGDGRADPCTGAVGRVPWFDLGLPDLRDNSGERLWYALASEFDGAAAINSDTTADLTLDTTPQIAAVIVAPGPVLGGQVRSPAAQGNAANYLEDDNNNSDGLYVTRSPGDFNDQVIAITRSEVLLKVEKRVLGEVKNALNDYYSANGFYYPNPAPWGSADCDSGINQGLVPLNISSSCASQSDWGGSARLPDWFAPNNWNQFIWYAVAPACTEPTPNCAGSGFITVQNLPVPNSNKRAVLLAPGPDPIGLQNPRPAMSVTDLLDDSRNNDEADLSFIDLPLDSSNNDQIKVVAP